MPICKVCKIDKDNSMFSMAKKNTRLDCKACHVAAEKKKLEKYKQTYLDVFGSSCVECGYNDCLMAIDFHHLLREEKQFEISKAHKNKETKAAIALELAKCVPLCRCCHRSAHSLADDGKELYEKHLKPAPFIFEFIFGAPPNEGELEIKQTYNHCACGEKIAPASVNCASCSARARNNSVDKALTGKLKTCQWCALELDESLFYVDKRRDKRYNMCSECHKNRAKQSQKDGKQLLTSLFFNKCALCPRANSSDMDFHHIDPSKKDFSISEMKNSSLEQTIPELAKCVMICANHHAEIHAGLHIETDLNPHLISEDLLRSRFKDLKKDSEPEVEKRVCPSCDQELKPYFKSCESCKLKSKDVIKAQKLLNKQSKKDAKVKHCACGVQITYVSECCPKCAGTKQLKITWPSDEDLIKKITSGYSFIALGKELGVSDNTIRKHLKRRGYTIKRNVITKGGETQ